MEHKDILRGMIICFILMLIVLAIVLASPAGAYDGTRITTARQDALHQAANLLRAAGLPDDDPAIRALGEAWMAEQEALDIVARVVMGEAGGCPCGVCEERFVGCHAQCEVFKAWQERQKERRKKLYQQNAQNDLLNDFKANSIRKSRRKKRK